MALDYIQQFANALSAVDVTKPSFLLALFLIAFQPTWWNIAARQEYRTHWITRLAGGAQSGVYLLSIAIISVGLVRDYCFTQAMEDQYVLPWTNPLFDYVAYALMGTGMLLVLSSTYALGWTNTFLGDYFGFLMPARVTGFPFNILSDPMYVGSTLIFFGHAVRYRSVAGVLLACFVGLAYYVALRFEGPFTDKIYSEATKHKNTNKAR